MRAVDIQISLSAGNYDRIRKQLGIETGISPWTSTTWKELGISNLTVGQTSFDILRTIRGHIGHNGEKKIRRIEKCTRQYLAIALDPYRLMNKVHDLADLWELSGFAQLTDTFDRTLLEILSFRLESLPAWTVNKIEYSLDVITKDGKGSATVEQYLHLMRQAAVARYFTAKDTVHLGYYLNDQSSEIHCFGLKSVLEYWTNASPDVLARSEKILRIEVALRRAKLTRIARSRGFKSEFGFFALPMVYNSILCRMLHPFITDCDYYSVRKAAARLNYHYDCDKRVYEGCRDMLKAIEEAGGLRNACAVWRNKKGINIRLAKERKKISLDTAQLRRRIQQLRTAGINPVPVPASWSKGQIENPLRDFWAAAAIAPEQKLQFVSWKNASCMVYDEYSDPALLFDPIGSRCTVLESCGDEVGTKDTLVPLKLA